jgi:energy-coupling factor transport system substrate-specific component
MKRRILSGGIFLAAALSGLVAFIYPFLLPDPAQASGDRLVPVMTAGLLIAALFILLIDLQGRATSAGTVATLGVLIAVASVLRFLEVAVPGPGGFSPIFAPIILVGYVLGGRHGFLMGALTMLVSALLTGGVGPWLPYQMFAAGWIGLTAGWLPQRSNPVLMLCAFSALWGILFGALMNLYFWPFAMGAGASGWLPGLSLEQALSRYGAFYAASSLLWDVMRAAGNVATLLILGMPAVRALRRFNQRLSFAIEEPQETATGLAPRRVPASQGP